MTVVPAFGTTGGCSARRGELFAARVEGEVYTWLRMLRMSAAPGQLHAIEDASDKRCMDREPDPSEPRRRVVTAARLPTEQLVTPLAAARYGPELLEDP